MFSSAYFSAGYFSSAYWSGVGGAVAVASTGGGNWRQVTDLELRVSAQRARAREEAKRRKRRKVAPTKPAEIAPIAAPVVASPSPEVDRLIDAVANPYPFADLGKRTRDKALADALARARETAELLATERRVTVGKVSRRSAVRGARSMRALVVAREVTRKAAPRVMVREEERRCEARTDRRSVVSTLTRLL